MTLLNNYDGFLKNTITVIEALAYTIAIIIISFSIFKSIVNYIQEYNNPVKDFYDTRLILGESLSLALTFILSVEVLKLFYIKSYKQLVMIVSLVLLKLLISYFLEYEIKTTPKNINNK